MKDILFSDSCNLPLVQEAEAIVKRSMVKLYPNKNVHLLYTEVDVKSVGEMLCIARYLRKTCDRIIILTIQDEFTHLVVAKSSNIPYLYVNEVVQKINRVYRGQMCGDEFLAYSSFYRHDIVPYIVDLAVESVIVAMPHID